MGQNVKWVPLGTTGGWVKAIENPVLGPEYGTTFDIHVIKEEHKYRMWFSWRDVRLIAHTISDDGIHCSSTKKFVAKKLRLLSRYRVVSFISRSSNVTFAF